MWQANDFMRKCWSEQDRKDYHAITGQKIEVRGRTLTQLLATMPMVFEDLAKTCKQFGSAIIIGPARDVVWGFKTESTWPRLVAGSAEALSELGIVSVLDTSEAFGSLPKSGMHFTSTAHKTPTPLRNRSRGTASGPGQGNGFANMIAESSQGRSVKRWAIPRPRSGITTT